MAVDDDPLTADGLDVFWWTFLVMVDFVLVAGGR
jgi:hypothetical protein